MKRLFLILGIMLLLFSSISFAITYDTGKIGLEEEFDKNIAFEDLIEPVMNPDGKQAKDIFNRPLFRYNPYINEILKATKVTIDKDNNKLITGYPNGTFKPNDNVTKAEFLKMAIGISVNRNFDFDAIPSSHIKHWAAPYVAVAEMQNVIDKGLYYEGNLNEPITRLEMIVILSKIQINMKGTPQYRDGELPEYEDISTLSEEEKGYLLHAARYELIEGMLDSNTKEIRPFDNITRGEAARAIIRVY